MASRHAKDALLLVQFHLESAKVRECFREVIKESAPLFGFHHDVFDVGMHVPSDLRLEAFLHASLVRGTCISQTKRHGDIAISPVRGNKGCLYLILWFQLDLVVA